MTRTEPTDGPDDGSEETEPTITLTFMCVRNAGRSQMATAFAEREVAERGLAD
ncbi:ArsC family transcriptional regulator, partial [Halorubrum tibetense]